MLLKSDKLVVAELSALYEISSIQFLQSEQDILNEATQKAIRLFGVRFFLVHANGDVVTSWGFRDSKKISKKAVERNKIKRRLSQVLGPRIGKLKPGARIIFLMKKEILGKSLAEIEKEVDKLVVKLEG